MKEFTLQNWRTTHAERREYLDWMDAKPEPLTKLDAMDLFEKDMYRKFGELVPNIRIITGIMASAKDSGDYNYFVGPSFKYHCSLLGLDHEWLLKQITEKELVSPKRPRRTPEEFAEIRSHGSTIFDKHINKKVTMKSLCAEYKVHHKFIADIIKEELDKRKNV